MKPFPSNTCRAEQGEVSRGAVEGRQPIPKQQTRVDADRERPAPPRVESSSPRVHPVEQSRRLKEKSHPPTSPPRCLQPVSGVLCTVHSGLAANDSASAISWWVTYRVGLDKCVCACMCAFRVSRMPSPLSVQQSPLLLLPQGFPLLYDHLAQLVHAFVQPLADDSAGRLDIPGGGRAEFVQRQLLL